MKKRVLKFFDDKVRLLNKFVSLSEENLKITLQPKETQELIDYLKQEVVKWEKRRSFVFRLMM